MEFGTTPREGSVVQTLLYDSKTCLRELKSPRTIEHRTYWQTGGLEATFYTSFSGSVTMHYGWFGARAAYAYASALLPFHTPIGIGFPR